MMQMDRVVVCGQVVDVVWDDSTGFNPLELVNACEAIVYDCVPSHPVGL